MSWTFFDVQVAPFKTVGRDYYNEQFMHFGLGAFAPATQHAEQADAVEALGARGGVVMRTFDETGGMVYSAYSADREALPGFETKRLWGLDDKLKVGTNAPKSVVHAQDWRGRQMNVFGQSWGGEATQVREVGHFNELGDFNEPVGAVQRLSTSDFHAIDGAFPSRDEAVARAKILARANRTDAVVVPFSGVVNAQYGVATLDPAARIPPEVSFVGSAEIVRPDGSVLVNDAARAAREFRTNDRFVKGGVAVVVALGVGLLSAVFIMG